jgi:hypothetical protein
MSLSDLQAAFLAKPTLATASAYFNRAMDLWTSDQIGDETALTVNREVVAWCKLNNHDLERLGLTDRSPAPTAEQFGLVFGP